MQTLIVSCQVVDQARCHTATAKLPTWQLWNCRVAKPASRAASKLTKGSAQSLSGENAAWKSIRGVGCSIRVSSVHTSALLC
mmetsp:Transcript_9843/g.13611  ORF Transcript_9843/g.13611 Transcript_9843/m.13611 type:complete len:82 (-) Transcript_9843:314-559(-)